MRVYVRTEDMDINILVYIELKVGSFVIAFRRLKYTGDGNVNRTGGGGKKEKIRNEIGP